MREPDTSGSSSCMDVLARLIRRPDMAYWPEVRWWLAVGLHTDETLRDEIRMIHEAGFGAAEFLAMPEDGVDNARYGWGSEEWVHDSRLIVKEAAARGMGFSLTSGTHWANANLNCIVPDDRSAAKELSFVSIRLGPGERFSGELPGVERDRLGISLRGKNVRRFDLIAVTAARRVRERVVSFDGKPQTVAYLDQGGACVLTGSVVRDDGGHVLDWTAPSDGEYELFVFWMHGTGQTASPSSGVNYTVNYVDPYGVDALVKYWDGVVLSDDLRADILRCGRGEMYMDSIEIDTFGTVGHLWGFTLLDEFRRRRGYDLVPYLPYIVRDGGSHVGRREAAYFYEMEGDADSVAKRVRYDFFQTMTGLYQDNILSPLRDWLHGRGMKLRAEISYGMPYEISTPAKYVDGVETESLDFASQLDSYRGMAGGAHVYGKRFSSETGALRYLNLALGLDGYMKIINTQFAAGVNRTVLHGYSSLKGSPSATRWPGHEGMYSRYSERFDARQPGFGHYPEWTAMLARCQALLCLGSPRVDVGILRSDYEYAMGLSTEFTDFLRRREAFYWRDMGLQDNGFTYDYFSPLNLLEPEVGCDGRLVSPDGPAYQALVVYQEDMPVAAAAVILEWARKGLPVLIVNGATELVLSNNNLGDNSKIYKTHPRAAVRDSFLNPGEGDGRLAAIMAEMRTLVNVVEIDRQADAVGALRELGVRPRADFVKPNANILTCMRESGEAVVLFAYNYMHDGEGAFSFGVSVAGSGVPQRVDCWSGDILELGMYGAEGGRTRLDLVLSPGQACFVVIDKTRDSAAIHAVASDADEVARVDGRLVAVSESGGTCRTELSDGRVVVCDIAAPENIELPLWNLAVEDWDEGPRREVREDRGLGYETVEAYYETAKKIIPVGKTALMPWKDIPCVGPDVSGIGRYDAEFFLPDDWSGSNVARLCLGAIRNCSAVVRVNGVKAGGVDFQHPVVDVTKLVRPGRNAVSVEVASPLGNRMIARNYYAENGMDVLFDATENPQPYGMTGPAVLRTYGTAVVAG